MGLLPGRFTPRLQESLARLGSKLTFAEAVAEVGISHRTEVGATTCRRVTYRSGRAAEALVCQEVMRLEAEGSPTQPVPERQAMSADGCFIHLTDGSWREVKSVAMGEYEPIYADTGVLTGVRTSNLSYFTRSYRVRDFERFALAELTRRGLPQAKSVVAVHDGAEWLQSFTDFHCPQAVRILDFAHALSHMAEAGRAIWGQGSDDFAGWFAHAAHQLKHEPPQRTLAELRLLRTKAKNEQQLDILDGAHFYLHKRLALIDYPYFLRRGYPIGSGPVESGHKQIVHRRLKQAGMRWAPHNVDPLLALRDLHANDRWQAGWQDIVAFQLTLRRERRCQKAQAQQPASAPPISFSALRAADLLPSPMELDAVPAPTRPKRDPKDHPWRRDLWPTRESWRWN